MTAAKPKIERAALRLFVESGVPSATTRLIANEAGVSEGALYRHYKGKDDLALHLFMETHNRLGEMLAEALSAGGTLEDRIGRAVSAYTALADEDFLLFSFHIVSLHRYVPYDTRRDDDPLTRLESLVSALMEAGEIERGDPALLTAMATGIVLQAAQNKVYNRLPGPLSAHNAEFTRAILAVLRPS